MLNTDDFLLLAGRPYAWDEETRRRTRQNIALTQVQEDQHLRGRRSAQLMRASYDWVVMLRPSLDEPAILFRNGSLDKVLEWGKRWANESPALREFIAPRSYLAGSRHDPAAAPVCSL